MQEQINGGTTMLKSVFVTNHHGERYELPLSSPDASGFLIKNISGIGPIKTSINTSSGALSPGEFFNSSKIQKRNIVLDIDYYDQGGIIEDQRLLLYKMFEVNTPVDVEFYTDRSRVVAHGYIESHEPTMFSEACGASISIVCTDPYLYALFETEFSMSDIIRTFKFSFFNPDPQQYTEDDPPVPIMEPTLMMGYYDKQSLKRLYNPGNASDTGLIIYVDINENLLSDFTFVNLTNNKRFALDDSVLDKVLPDGVQIGDRFIINSIRGNKSITVRRGAFEYNILPAKEYGCDWLTLDSGMNEVMYYCNGGDNTANVILKYTPAYLGV